MSIGNLEKSKTLIFRSMFYYSAIHLTSHSHSAGGSSSAIGYGYGAAVGHGVTVGVGVRLRSWRAIFVAATVSQAGGRGPVSARAGTAIQSRIMIIAISLRIFTTIRGDINYPFTLAYPTPPSKAKPEPLQPVHFTGYVNHHSSSNSLANSATNSLPACRRIVAAALTGSARLIARRGRGL